MANGLERVDLYVGHRHCPVLGTSYTDKMLTYLPVVREIAGVEESGRV